MYLVQEEVVFCGEFRGDSNSEKSWVVLGAFFFLVLLVCQCWFIHNKCLCFHVGQLCCEIIFRTLRRSVFAQAPSCSFNRWPLVSQPDSEDTGQKKSRVSRRCRRSKTYWRTGKATNHVEICRLIELGSFKLKELVSHKPKLWMSFYN